ncbi:MAG: GNAT family N-acetyltransferase [Bacteroidales bacterium]
MEFVRSYQDIQLLMTSIRNLRKGFITNFYPEEFKINLWISNKELFFEQYSESIFFVHQNDDFFAIFYCSTSLEALDNSLKVTQFKDRLVADIITSDISSPILDVFYDHKFIRHSSLVRMSRMSQLTGPDSCYPSENIKNAELSDIPEIRRLFNSYFDKFTEQIPIYEELEQWIKQSHIIVYKKDLKIAGFLIYDLIGVTLYLRYWFVCPEYRDKKIGSELFKEFSYRGKGTKRQIFWVIESNDNAIKRYEHYGFMKEKMFDYVLIKIIDKDERRNN